MGNNCNHIASPTDISSRQFLTSLAPKQAPQLQQVCKLCITVENTYLSMSSVSKIICRIRRANLNPRS